MAQGRTRRLRVLRTYEGPPEGYGHAAIIAMMRVQWRLHDLASRMTKAHGLTLPHFDVLVTLRLSEGISQQELAKRLLVTKGNVCVIAQKLEMEGLIERRSDPTDQRFHRLYLTEAGRKMLARIYPEHVALNARVMGGLSVAEQRTLHDLLARVDEALDDIEG